MTKTPWVFSFVVLLVAVRLSGCAWHYETTPVQIRQGYYDVVCPDPLPLLPGAIVGSTPCELRERGGKRE